MATTCSLSSADQWSVQLEAGAVWQNRNDAKISPETGTYFEFDQFDQGPFFHYRTEGFYNLEGKHYLRGVIAPFMISVTGEPEQNINFDGVTFQAGSPLTVDYQFNSYRLTYIYRWVDNKSFHFDVGLTMKWRDAKINLIQSASSRAYTNGGLVPLVYLATGYQFNDYLEIFSDLDASAAPQGRAFDFSFKLRTPVNDRLKAGAGLRTLEGGADNDKVFTFSWFNYALIDLVWALK